jgi:hypothetical protein
LAPQLAEGNRRMADKPPALGGVLPLWHVLPGT